MPLESSLSEAFRPAGDRATEVREGSLAGAISFRGDPEPVQPRGGAVVSGGNEAVAQHDLFEPRRIRLAGTRYGLRDLLEIGAADAAGVQHEQRSRRLAAEILVVMNGAAGNQQRIRRRESRAFRH